MNNLCIIAAIIVLPFAGRSGNVSAATLTTLHSFSGGDGAFPQAALVQGRDGNFYGLTSQGGTSGNNGTVFKINAAGILTPLWQFTGGTDGFNPWGGLVEGRHGKFYGTAGQGGSYGLGTVYRITARGRLTPLWQFIGDGDGGAPFAALVRGRDGDFYGTSLGGPESIYGTVYKITDRGRLTPLWQFSGRADGAAPWGALVQGNDGDFYGTALGGPGSQYGTVFKITSAGVLTPLYQFTGSEDGGGPAGLVQGRDGDFYGATAYGGKSGRGTVFKISSAGALTPLYQFGGGADGGGPFAALAQGSDGNFYGTTTQGGTNDLGTVFTITPAGILTTLHQFSGVDGRIPLAALVQGRDGHFYGTTANGGADDKGTVFKLSIP